MITLGRLRARNALGFPELDVNLTRQGVVFLTGRNVDTGGNNASGKTNLCDIIRASITGKTSGGLSRNDLVSYDQAGGMLIDLESDHSGSAWRTITARRHRQYGTGISLYADEDGRWVPRTPKNLHGRDAAQEGVRQLFRVTEAEFDARVYLTQGSAHVLVNGTPQECCRFLSAAFPGVARLDDLIEKIGKRLKRDKSRFDDLERAETEVSVAQEIARQHRSVSAVDSLLRTADYARRHADEAIAELSRRIAAMEHAEQNRLLREDLLRRFAELKVTPDREKLARAADRYAERIRAWDVAAEVNERISRTRERQRELEREYRRLRVDPKRTAVLVREDLRAAQARAQEAVAQHDAAVRIEEIRAELAEAQERLGAESEKRAAADLTRSIAESRAAATSARQQIARLRALDAGACPTCTQDVSAQHIDRCVADLTRQLRESERDEQALRRALARAEDREAARARVDELETEMADLRGSISVDDLDVEQTAADVARLRAELVTVKRAEQIRYALDQMGAADDDADEVETELNPDDRERLVAGHKRATAALRLLDRLDAIPEAPPHDDEDRLRRRFREVNAARDRLMSQIGAWRQEASASRAADARVRDAEVAVHAFGPLRRDRFVLNAALKALRRLRITRLRRIVRAISEALPRYVAIMFREPGLTFRLDEEDEYSLRFVAVRRTGQRKKPVEVPVRRLSGGDRRRLSVALLFTLRDVLASDQAIDLLILDEVDYGLDSNGVKSLMQIVDVCRERCGTVLMTSHRPELRKAAFDQIWTVVRENDVSRLETRRLTSA